MKKDTLKSINRIAMDAKDSILFFGYDRKYEWRLWGYLDALYYNDIIDIKEHSKIRKHYRKYFKAIKSKLDR